MIKRMTLLRRRKDLTDAAFRQHWAVPHAAIAKGFEGIERYDQNRVDRICWRTGDAPYQVDGLVELWFTSQEVLHRNATSATSKALTADEPRFLSGLTGLSIGERRVEADPAGHRKFMVLARARDQASLAEGIDSVLAPLAAEGRARVGLDPLTPYFTRDTLAYEANPPTVCVTVWIVPEAADRTLAALVQHFGNLADCAIAYAVDPLRIV